jgi:hypothetical protein
LLVNWDVEKNNFRFRAYFFWAKTFCLTWLLHNTKIILNKYKKIMINYNYIELSMRKSKPVHADERNISPMITVADYFKQNSIFRNMKKNLVPGLVTRD